MARLLMAARDAFIIGASRDGHSSGEIARALGLDIKHVVGLLRSHGITRGADAYKRRGFLPAVPPGLPATRAEALAAKRSAVRAARMEKIKPRDDRDFALCALYEHGHRMSDLAIAFGVNIGTVSRIVERHGVKPRVNGTRAPLDYVPCVEPRLYAVRIGCLLAGGRG